MIDSIYAMPVQGQGSRDRHSRYEFYLLCLHETFRSQGPYSWPYTVVAIRE